MHDIASEHVTQEGQAVFFCLVATAVEVVWWTRLKRLQTDIFLFSESLIKLFEFHLEKKMRVEKEVMSLNTLVERWMNLAKMTRVSGPTLIMHL